MVNKNVCNLGMRVMNLGDPTSLITSIVDLLQGKQAQKLCAKFDPNSFFAICQIVSCENHSQYFLF